METHTVRLEGGPFDGREVGPLNPGATTVQLTFIDEAFTGEALEWAERYGMAEAFWMAAGGPGQRRHPSPPSHPVAVYRIELDPMFGLAAVFAEVRR